MQKQLRGDAGKEKLAVEAKPKFTQELMTELVSKYRGQLRDALLTEGKKARGSAVKDLQATIIAAIPAEDTERIDATKHAFAEMETRLFREIVVNEQKRLDGRSFKQIRPISIDIAVLPRTHGSAVFTRGETQALVTVTLGTPQEAQKIEDFEGETFQRFMLHYNFPPF